MTVYGTSSGQMQNNSGKGIHSKASHGGWQDLNFTKYLQKKSLFHSSIGAHEGKCSSYCSHKHGLGSRTSITVKKKAVGQGVNSGAQRHFQKFMRKMEVKDTFISMQKYFKLIVTVLNYVLFMNLIESLCTADSFCTTLQVNSLINMQHRITSL